MFCYVFLSEDSIECFHSDRNLFGGLLAMTETKIELTLVNVFLVFTL